MLRPSWIIAKDSTLEGFNSSFRCFPVTTITCPENGFQNLRDELKDNNFSRTYCEIPVRASLVVNNTIVPFCGNPIRVGAACHRLSWEAPNKKRWRGEGDFGIVTFTNLNVPPPMGICPSSGSYMWGIWTAFWNWGTGIWPPKIEKKKNARGVGGMLRLQIDRCISWLASGSARLCFMTRTKEWVQCINVRFMWICSTP